MTRHPSLLLALGLLIGACAANPPAAPPSTSHAAARGPASTPADPPITEASVLAHLEFLAGDALNGRGSGTRDEWLAAAYVASHMRRWGLEPLGDAGGYIQTVEMEHSEAAAAPVLAYPGGRVEHGGRMVVVALSSDSAAGPLQKLATNETVKPGAVALLPPGARTTGIPGTQSAALLLVPETPQVRAAWATLGGRVPATRPVFTTLEDASPRRPTTIILARDAYDAIAALPAESAISFQAQLKPPQKTRTWNAVGQLRGADASAAGDVILLSAHLDHLGARAPAAEAAGAGDGIYNGADDDASGTVAVLELAGALAEGPRPNRTIVFALFGSEEAGGAGSRFFAGRPPAPLPQVIANLQFEMIGRPDKAVPPHTLWLTGYERSTLGPELARQGAKLVQDPHPEQNFFERSDNIQFARRGIVAHTVSSYGLHEEYHRPSDEVRLIDVAHMTDAIRSMLAPIQWLANSTFKPEWLPGKRPESR